jgi:predicted nuclease of restriction endonuclease-like (RecB) superfamily
MSPAKRKPRAPRERPVSPAIAAPTKPAAPRSRGRIREEGASFPLPPRLDEVPADYGVVLADLRQRIVAAQTRAALAVNTELISLYWQVGAVIAQRHESGGWGNAVVERLAHDLRRAFPDLEGFSARNIWRMRAFHLAWSGAPGSLSPPAAEPSTSPPSMIVPQPVALSSTSPPSMIVPQPVALSSTFDPAASPPRAVTEIPWGHNVILLEKLGRPEERLWYAERTRENGWSRAMLQDQIARKAHTRQGKAITNFARALSPPQSEIAQQALKDPYNFDFLTVGREAHERVTERDLVAHVREFLIELGAGFAFIGNQVKILVGGDEFYIDLLFYHVRLRCYVVVDLKATAFKPEHAGKMSFYLSAVDDMLKHPGDQPSIGLLLCRSRSRLHVEYALRDLNKPIGVAAWETQLVEQLPEELKGSLPTVEEIEAELGARRK